MSKQSWFERNAKKIEGISAIATCLGVLTALVYSSLNYFSEKEPELLIAEFKNFSEGGVKDVVVYNRGDAPCLNFIVEYTNTFSEVRTIYNYERGALSAVAFNKETGLLEVPARIKVELAPESHCYGRSSCLYNPGILAEGELHAMQFVGEGPGTFTASCEYDSWAIEING